MPDFMATFANEVKSMASLDHPGILAVYDHGVVTQGSELASGGTLPVGSPWLAMELASGGNLVQRAGSAYDWPQIRRWLDALLNALAHAHARGIVHRDIKPSNLLLGGANDSHSGLKLSDFDLARSFGDGLAPGMTEFAAGTPYYMAPEQCEGRWRDYGPWTDLYAVGCVAFELVCGKQVVEGATLEAVMGAHSRGDHVPFEAMMEAPDGLAGWLETLLQRHHPSRYRYAADALSGLATLGPMVPANARAATSRSQPKDVLTLESVPPWQRGPEVLPPLPVAPVAPALPRIGDWRSSEEDVARQRSSRFSAIALPLFHLRAHPIIARDDERDSLWRALHRVRLTQAARLVLMRGPSGTGKSALGRWLRERAHELGLAETLRAGHASSWGHNLGLPAMLARHMRCVGLTPKDAAEHLRTTLQAQGVTDEGEWLALAELISPGVATNRPKMAVRLANPTERYTVIRRALERIARDRPVIIHLEDVHCGMESLGFVQHLLEAQATHPSPILIVADVGTDDLAERGPETELIDSLMARRDTELLEIEPLAGESRKALIRELIGLTGPIAHEVEQRTAGNPLFVVQLVEDWITKGILETHLDGLRLRDGAEVALPESVHNAWSARIERLLADRPDSEGHALELAAVLGLSVEKAQWRAACELASIAPPRRLVASLLEARLVSASDQGPSHGFVFIHAMLRESLVIRAQEGGRLEALHQACALMLRDRPAVARAERLGLHWMAAGADEEAMMPLLEGARERMDAGECDAALGLLNRFDEALEKASSETRRDEIRGEAQLLRCDILLLVARLTEAEVAIDEVTDLSMEEDWPRVLAGALVRRAEISRMRGDLGAAHGVVEPAMLLARQVNAPIIEARAMFERGWVFMRQGDFEKAKKYFVEGFEGFIEGGEIVRAGDCQMGLGNCFQQEGDVEAAAEAYERTHALYLEGGSRKGLIRLYVTRGEIARHRGQLEVAEALYREALERCAAVGYGGVIWPLINLGVTLLQANRAADAQEPLARCLAEAERQGRRAVVGWTHLLLAVSAAGRREWAGFDEHLAEGVKFVTETGAVELDVATSAEQGASYALSAGEWHRAKQALEIARQQWEGLRRHQDVARVDEQIAQIEQLGGLEG